MLSAPVSRLAQHIRFWPSSHFVLFAAFLEPPGSPPGSPTRWLRLPKKGRQPRAEPKIHPKMRLQPCPVFSCAAISGRKRSRALPSKHNTTQVKMSAVGSLVFCTDCGNLLDASTGNKNNVLTCDCCGAENQGTKVLSRPALGIQF